jgi:hypothetical protein
MTDIMIFVSAVIAFVVFFIVHVIVFRRIDHAQVIRWVIIVYGVSLMGLIGTLLFLHVDIFSIILSWILFSQAIAVYILWIFGSVESSLRLHLLHAIAKAGGQGISIQKLQRLYTNEQMMEKRLHRFLASGEIREIQGRYHWSKKISYFVLNDYLHLLFIKMYK